MEVLLHICCFECLIYPYKVLRSSGVEVKGFFYNPNIHPVSEYHRRLYALQEYAKLIGLKVDFGEYDFDEYLRRVVFNEDQRCVHCYMLRLNTTAKFAKKYNIGYFTTTLLVSPYQNHELIKKISEEIMSQEGVNFYYQDFRVGFNEAKMEAKKFGLYRQSYCGCLFSEYERYKHKKGV